jgi:hypothetical protein
MEQTAKLELIAAIHQYGELTSALTLAQTAPTVDPRRVERALRDVEDAAKRIRVMLDAI